jgi:hypothetical protein
VPPEVREGMTFTFVTGMDEVLRLALLPAPVPRADLAPEAAEADRSQDAPPSAAAVAPVADGDGLAVGENRRTPGARDGDAPAVPPLADVSR